jgi:hypothetical protein
LSVTSYQPSVVKRQPLRLIASGTPDEFVEHIARDLLDRWIAATNETWMKLWISTLGTDGGTIVGTIGGGESSEIVVESPRAT